MKKLLLLVLTLALSQLATAQIVNIPDANFKAALLSTSSNMRINGELNYSFHLDRNNNYELDLDEALLVTSLEIKGTNISDLTGLEAFGNLTYLSCINTGISNLDVTKNLKLVELACGSSPITNIDVTKNLNLEKLRCIEIPIANLDVTKNINLKDLELRLTQITNIDLSQNINLNRLQGYENQFTKLDVSQNINLTQLSCSKNQLTHLDVSQNINLNYLDCWGNQLTHLDVSQNTKLISLSLLRNNISNLDVSKNLYLEELYCGENRLMDLDVSQNINLNRLECNQNQLTQLDVSQNINLYYLDCFDNQIAKLDVSRNKNLQYLLVGDNKIANLDLSQNINLYYLYCRNNQISNLDLSKNKELGYILCGENLLTTLDLNLNKKLILLDVENSPYLTSMFIKILTEHDTYFTTPEGTNGWEFWGMYLKDLPNLKYVCVNEGYEERMKEVLNYFNYTCEINSYCSFTPSGDYYTLKAKKIDCRDETIFMPNNGYIVSKGTTRLGMFMPTIKDNTSNILLKAGDYKVTPIVENPDYYNVTPEFINVSFPKQESPYIQDFCFTPKGDFNDLEINMTPIGIPARPGFDADYKIIYKNKGTTTLSGTINLKYMDDVLDYAAASSAFSSRQNNQMIWDFEGLKPFETREIVIRLNVNSPQETPAVNIDDVLNFYVQLSYDGEDKTPEDNSFEYSQTVVGSWDPNDKTCMQGKEVLEDMIGQYVHYRIRFENTGTFPAQNIVVVDEIDESKFDVSTLVPLNASHDFETRIKGNKVEFIFEGIQLPFEDDSNDGYVFFKIKTLPTLKLGDSFSNQASIYFDFNFPIITNNETTTIVQEHLGVGDFDFNEELTAYPNPVQDRLYITPNSDAQLQSLEIYNLQGQMVQSVPQVTKTSFDLSHLPQGTYVVKVKTDKGNTTTKVVKE